MASTRLIRKGKDPIAPDDIKMIQRGGSADLLFYFPPTPPILPDDKEVTFSTRIGSTKVKYKLKLKEMTCNGKLELN